MALVAKALALRGAVITPNLLSDVVGPFNDLVTVEASEIPTNVTGEQLQLQLKGLVASLLAARSVLPPRSPAWTPQTIRTPSPSGVRTPSPSGACCVYACCVCVCIHVCVCCTGSAESSGGGSVASDGHVAGGLSAWKALHGVHFLAICEFE